MNDTELRELLASYAAAGRRTPVDLEVVRRRAVRRNRGRTMGTALALGSILASALLLLPTGGDDTVEDLPAGRPSPAPSAQVEPAVAQVVLPTTTAQLTGAPFEDLTATFDPAGLRVGKDLGPSGGTVSAAALAFPPFTDPGRCLEQVQLVLPLSRVSAPAQLSVYPSAALSLARRAVPATGDGGPQTLLDNRPKGSSPALLPDQPTATFDITELSRLWADGAPFPSTGRSVPRGTPLVLLVRADDFADGTFDVDVTGAAASAGGPRLRVLSSC